MKKNVGLVIIVFTSFLAFGAEDAVSVNISSPVYAEIVISNHAEMRKFIIDRSQDIAVNGYVTAVLSDNFVDLGPVGNHVRIKKDHAGYQAKSALISFPIKLEPVLEMTVGGHSVRFIQNFKTDETVIDGHKVVMIGNIGGEYVRPLKSYIAGLKNAYKAYGGKTGRIFLINFRLNNTFSVVSAPDVYVNTYFLLRNKTEVIASAAEHEALHIHADAMGYAGNPEVAELFQELRKAPLSEAARRYKFNRREKNRIVHPFFLLINEENYIGLGGHSEDNPDEFCASFLHSLMHYERIRPQLEGMPELNAYYSRMLKIFFKGRDCSLLAEKGIIL